MPYASSASLMKSSKSESLSKSDHPRIPPQNDHFVAWEKAVSLTVQSPGLKANAMMHVCMLAYSYLAFKKTVLNFSSLKSLNLRQPYSNALLPVQMGPYKIKTIMSIRETHTLNSSSS